MMQADVLNARALFAQTIQRIKLCIVSWVCIQFVSLLLGVNSWGFGWYFFHMRTPQDLISVLHAIAIFVFWQNPYNRKSLTLFMICSYISGIMEIPTMFRLVIFDHYYLSLWFYMFELTPQVLEIAMGILAQRARPHNPNVTSVNTATGGTLLAPQQAEAQELLAALPVGSITPFNAMCCYIESCLCTAPECYSCKFAGEFLCIEESSTCCVVESRAESRNCCICNQSSVKLIECETCCQGIHQSCCLRQRYALPINHEVPCICTICYITCCADFNFTPAFGKTIAELIPRYQQDSGGRAARTTTAQPPGAQRASALPMVPPETQEMEPSAPDRSFEMAPVSAV